MKRLALLILALGLLGGWWIWRPRPAATAAKPRSIAVAVATARASDVPVWQTGIGTVQANNTVTVRPRVGGELASLHFTEGQEVKAGELLAQIDPRPYQAALNQAMAQHAQDEARVANDRREYERIQGLVASNTESRQLLDQRAATLAQSIAQAKASQAAVETARLQLEYTSVRAPIDGVTGIRLVDAGNLVTASQSNGLVVLTQTRPILVLFTVPQQHLPRLREGMARSAGRPLEVEALNDAGKVMARGTLALIDNQIDASTGTVRLKATFPNDDQLLWPGQFVNARVLIETQRQVVVVPSEAVQPGLNGTFVYVAKADSTVEARNVKLGSTGDGLTVVAGGLQAGERVVREGQNKLQPGARIEFSKSAGDPGVPAGGQSPEPPATIAP